MLYYYHDENNQYSVMAVANLAEPSDHPDYCSVFIKEVIFNKLPIKIRPGDRFQFFKKHLVPCELEDPNNILKENL